MAVQSPKTYSAHQSDILQALAATGIRQLAPGGKARAFGDIVANELAELEQRQFGNVAQSLLPFATDTSLDLLGEIFGVPRLTQQTASVDVGDGNFEWYVRSGTFGDINSGRDIVIPSGVRIYTAAGVSGPTYISSAVTLPAGGNSVFFSASALYPGAPGNGAAGIFSTSNFTNYTESRFGSLLVRNNYGIVGGRDAESDDDYRYRIRLKLQAPNGANEAALRFQILQVPGIQDVVFDTAAGTFTCYVYGIAWDGSAALLKNVRTAMNKYCGFPVDGDRRGTPLGISSIMTIDGWRGHPRNPSCRAIAKVITIVITLEVAVVELKVRKFGNSLGVVLPKEVINRLHAGDGEPLFLIEAPEGGYRLTPYDPEFRKKMAKADDIISRYRNTLHVLAK